MVTRERPAECRSVTGDGCLGYVALITARRYTVEADGEFEIDVSFTK